ncbi:unnamed protein product, partial [Meganyctiphanes norvegica]
IVRLKLIQKHSLSILILVVTGGTFVTGTCPGACTCPLDTRGRRQVLCLGGGLQDPLPVLDMPSDTEVLHVEAPRGRSNSLTLGPIFKGLRRLEKITVYNSNIPALGAHSFWGLRRLGTLNVSHNQIAAIMDTNFRGADSLRVLDLSHNLIESIPSAVFRHVRRLQNLSVAHNRLPELVPRLFFGLAKLESLDISYNPLGDLPAERFTDAPNLKEFRCAGCGLSIVSEELFKSMPQLNFLDLRHNRLTEVPPVAISFNLKMLRLDGNHISLLKSGTFSGLPLEVLTISHNRLTAMQSGALTNISLTHLNLANNRLTNLRVDVLGDNLDSIHYLQISGNPLHIEKLLESIPQARHLRHLSIADLGITRIPQELLRHARHLKHLNASGNYLSSFPSSALFSTPHLATLDLSHNSFRGLTQELVTAFSSMTSLEQVYLGGNPWVCQKCHVAALLEWITSPFAITRNVQICHRSPQSIECLKCAGPSMVKGSYLPLLTKAQLTNCGPSQAAWPSWLGGSVPQRDDPRTSRDSREQQASGSTYKNREYLNQFFQDHLALIVGAGCGMVLALLVVVVAALILSRRHTALYYTHEHEDDNDSSKNLMGSNNNDNSPPNVRPKPQQKIQPNVSFSRDAAAAIATIDEVESLDDA